MIGLVEQKYFSRLLRFQPNGRANFRDSMACVDKLFLMKQLFKFKILLYLFFLAQLYATMKSLFFYVLNMNSPTSSCLMLYGEVR